jgi:uncharacterized protein (TIGR02453 family)
MGNMSNLTPVLDFLSRLQEYNNRAWFEENRATYQAAREQFETFIDGVIDALRAVDDLGDLTAQDCVMRIYRDVRFSKDKSPYRTNMAASIAPGGRKSSRLPYYLQVAPQGQSFIAGGLYMPSPAQLARFREAIDRDVAPLKAVLNDKKFKRYFGTLGGDKLKTAPQGYPRDHAEIELLRLKQAVALHPLSDETVVSATFPAYVVKVFTALKPFLDYLNKTIQ